MEKLEFDVALRTIGSYKKVAELQKEDLNADLFVWNDIGIYYAKEGYAGIVGHFPLDLSMKICRRYRNSKDFIVSGQSLDIWQREDIKVTDLSFNRDSYSESTISKFMRYFYVKDPEMLIDIMREFASYYDIPMFSLDYLITNYRVLYGQQNRKNIVELSQMPIVTPNYTYRILFDENTDKATVVPRFDFHIASDRNCPNPLDGIIINLLEDLDDCINPFQGDFELDDYGKYSKRVRVNVEPIKEGETKCTITDETGSIARFTKTSSGLIYEVMTQLDIDTFVKVAHCQTRLSLDDAFSGNVIEISKNINSWNSSNLHRGSCIYNMTTGMKVQNGECSKMTDDDRKALIDELEMAISYACGITLDNMMRIKDKNMLPQKANKIED